MGSDLALSHTALRPAKKPCSVYFHARPGRSTPLRQCVSLREAPFHEDQTQPRAGSGTDVRGCAEKGISPVAVVAELLFPTLAC